MSDSINPKYKYLPEEIPEVNALFAELVSGNRVALAKAITLIESTAVHHQQMKHELLGKCNTHKQSGFRIGITGVPGAGKSTFIEAFGTLCIQKGHKVAVLAIDPSSTRTKGSILGDKTRMQQLSVNPNAFIRPTASAGNLGGIAATTKDVMLLCEAAGFDRVIIETVGVGQSETMVNDMTDIFLLLAVSGTGDELQGIKRGIMEMANIIAINKADGDNIAKANQAAMQLKNALHLYPVNKNEWLPKVVTISSLEKNGIAELYELIESFIGFQKANGEFDKKRVEQEKKWLDNYLLELMQIEFLGHIHSDKLKALKSDALGSGKSIYEAAVELIKKLKSK